MKNCNSRSLTKMLNFYLAKSLLTENEFPNATQIDLLRGGDHGKGRFSCIFFATTSDACKEDKQKLSASIWNYAGLRTCKTQ